MTQPSYLPVPSQNGILDVPNVEVGSLAAGGASVKRLLNHMRAFELWDLRSYFPSRLPLNQR
ncbi:MAG: hypothetical protein ACI4SW_00130, partial [Thermoguttaceae bacterium]